MHEHEGQLAVLDLLVVRHVREQLIGDRARARNVAQSTWAGRPPSDAATKRSASWPPHRPSFDREPERQRHADGDAFAMQQPVGISGRRFQRMAERVAEIEQRAFAGFAFVARHDLGLHAAGMRDGMRRLPAQSPDERLRAIRFQPFEKSRIAQRAVFHDLGIAGEQLAPRQGVKQRRCRR